MRRELIVHNSMLTVRYLHLLGISAHTLNIYVCAVINNSLLLMGTILHYLHINTYSLMNRKLQMYNSVQIFS